MLSLQLPSKIPTKAPSRWKLQTLPQHRKGKSGISKGQCTATLLCDDTTLVTCPGSDTDTYHLQFSCLWASVKGKETFAYSFKFSRNRTGTYIFSIFCFIILCFYISRVNLKRAYTYISKAKEVLVCCREKRKMPSFRHHQKPLQGRTQSTRTWRRTYVCLTAAQQPPDMLRGQRLQLLESDALFGYDRNRLSEDTGTNCSCQISPRGSKLPALSGGTEGSVACWPDAGCLLQACFIPAPKWPGNRRDSVFKTLIRFCLF